VWHYLYRAVDKFDNTIDFMLSKKRNESADKVFVILNKLFSGIDNGGHYIILKSNSVLMNLKIIIPNIFIKNIIQL
jgi:hypothetical protein